MLSRAMPDDSSEIEINNGIPLQQRAPGSQLRNGSITVSLQFHMSKCSFLSFSSVFRQAALQAHLQIVTYVRGSIALPLTSSLTGLD
jgi:hypothetical protein